MFFVSLFSSGLSRPVWGAWIEITMAQRCAESNNLSRPVWGAWIEMVSNLTYERGSGNVAPRMGRVD